MALARSGQHQPAITKLESLLKSDSTNRSIQRDLMKVYAWAGNCRSALRLHQRIRSNPVKTRPNAADIGAAADCLIEDERYLKAISLLTPATRKYKHDRKIQSLYRKARTGLDNQKKWFNYNGIEHTMSSKGSNETALETEIFQKKGDSLTLFARLNLKRGYDPILPDGDLKRLGLGFDYRFLNGLTIREELSGNLAGDVNTGLLTQLKFTQSNLVTYIGEFASFAEDIPLSAIGQNIASDRFLISINYNSEDYKYEGETSVKQYRFDDSNLRNGVSTSIAYAYHRKPDHWRRAGLSIDHESNSLAGPAYFNPSDANTILVFHSWELPIKSKTRPHKDLLTLKAGLYAQAGYKSDFIYEIAYEQNYPVSKDSAFQIGGSLASNVYDGKREMGTSFRFSYLRSF